MSESDFVGRDSTSESEVLDPQGWNQLPLLEPGAEDTPRIAAIEASQVYDALPDKRIRLLRTIPGHPGGEVCCEIGQYILSEQTAYSALSYTWGAEPAEHTVKLNGKRVCVRKNLLRFLQQARNKGGQLAHLIWIDALCIDQSNYDEA